MMSRLDAATQLAGMKGNDADAAVAVLAQVLDRDPFYGVRSAAAKSLAILGTASARTALLAALHQEDNRVRAAVIRALGAFHGDQTVYPALVDTLDRDPSYAVEGAAAEALGASGMPGAFAVLQAKAATGSEIHLMGSLFAGLAATRDSRAVPLLMGYARPGVPERIRLGALDALAQTRAVATREDRQALTEVTGAALRESFVSVQQAGVRLAGAFGLTEFRGELETEAETAPTAFQRDTARQALAQIPQ